MRDGGYDDGYASVPCFWGVGPSSLVRVIVDAGEVRPGMRVLDLGCGEGRNAAALATLGAHVDAVDCSSLALARGQRQFQDTAIRWICADALSIQLLPEDYDIVLLYGILHCLSDRSEASEVIRRAKIATRKNGLHAVCAFNSRAQDMRGAHPGFSPLLLEHSWFVDQYAAWTCVTATDQDLREVHPHNGIPHSHSMSRLLVRKTDA